MDGGIKLLILLKLQDFISSKLKETTEENFGYILMLHDDDYIPLDAHRARS